MKTVLITLPVDKDDKEFLMKMVDGSNEEYRLIYRDKQSLDLKTANSADAIIGMIDPAVLCRLKCLEWLQLAWAGAEQYLKPGILSENTILTNASGAYGVTVAEHMMALTLALNCNLKQYIDQQKKHKWERCDNRQVLSGSRILVVGMGDIGRNYAMRMKVLGAHVIGISRTKKENQFFFDEQYEIGEMDEVIDQADVVAISLPGGSNTYHLFGEEQIRRMKKNAVLINAGRGSTIDTPALVRALKNKEIRGAGLDVFEEEPLQDSELWEMDNVIITPHIAGKLEEEYNRRQVVKICADNLYRYTHGLDLIHIVDRALGY
ncbi:MAG: D-2-hydroxyacid dehydrogenase [Lachnospiraceae bacterium]|nr:D-2-hydroxyacid dehydrogenase [Lachnospiraceae bacterium]MBR6852116.1 D-2-hydroxyacid dehydrogenase [Lachnospiraceae bacterium]